MASRNFRTGRWTLASKFSARLSAAACLISLVALPNSLVASVLNITGSVTLSQTGMTFGASSQPTGVYTGMSGTLAIAQPVPLAGGPIPNFVIFQAAPNTSITLNSLSPGHFPAVSCGAAPATGQSCSPPGSPLNFVNTPGGASIQFTANGDALSLGASSPVTGVYTVQFPGVSYQQLLTSFSQGETLNSTYSAVFNSTAGTFGLTGDIALNSAAVFFGATKISAGTANTFLIGGGADGPFAGLSGTTGIIANLAINSANIANFMIFAVNPNLSLDLSTLDLNIFGGAECFLAPATSQQCSLPGSPLAFYNTNGGSVGLFTLDGVLNTLGGPQSVQGIFTTQFAGMSYQQLLQNMLTGLSVTGEYSASFVAGTGEAPIPEPASWSMLAIGTLALALRMRRNRS